MKSWVKIIAFLIRVYDRLRIRWEYKKGWIGANRKTGEMVEDIRDVIHSDDPVNVSDDAIIRRETEK